MGIFGEFYLWLEGLLATYIMAHAQRVAQTIEPIAIALATLYVMVWAYLQMTGRIEEPALVGVKRILALAIVLGAGLSLWHYEQVIVDTFFTSPAQLSRAVVQTGAAGDAGESVQLVDEIMFAADEIAGRLFVRGGFTAPSFTLAGVVVYLLLGGTAVYTVFLLSLARIAIAVLLAVGPLFIVLLLFDASRRFFESWLAQLAHYGLLAVLTALVAAFMIAFLTNAAEDALAQGPGIQIAHAVRVCLAAGLTVLVMRQVPSIAAGLASGVALSTYGVMSGLAMWATGRAWRSAAQFSRGLALDSETSRWDSLSRKAGYYARRGMSVLARRDNQIRQAR